MPGGRFREVYYWDSYFTMLGFGAEQADLRRNMVMNFAHQIRRYGHIPNGNRTYYLSRSQPPFFYRMVALLAPERPATAWAEFLPELRAEHAFWMQDAAQSTPEQASRRVVTMPDGSLLNRYWDARDVPRDESFREDVEAAEAAGDVDRSRLYRDFRAAAESGWDFSSRWFADGESIATTRTTSIVPVDLNSLLYGLEQAIAEGCRESGDSDCARPSTRWRRTGASAMHRFLWNEATGVYDDWLWTERRRLGHVTAATLYPLFAGLATDEQAARIAAVVREELLEDGGLRQHEPRHRPTVGCAERLGALAMDRRDGTASLRAAGARRDHCEALAVACDERVCEYRQALGEIQRRHPDAGRWRRIPAAGRVRLDERRHGGAVSAVPVGRLRIRRRRVR